MLMTIPPENLERVMAIFEKEDVTAVAIGRLIPERRLQTQLQRRISLRHRHGIPI